MTLEESVGSLRQIEAGTTNSKTTTIQMAVPALVCQWSPSITL